MKKMYLIVFVLGLCLLYFVCFFDPPTYTSDNYPTIRLKGKINVFVPYGGKYKEKGYFAYDKEDGNIRKKVKVKNNIDTKKLGRQQIIYEVTNSKGNMVKTSRFVTIEKSNTIPYSIHYDKIDNEILYWGTNNKKDGKRPLVNIDPVELKKYNAYAMGRDEKVLYLTFDEGSLENYLPQIVDVLNKNDVKATFFLCYTFMKKNKKLIKEMVEKGHSIGNHTAHHVSMSTLASSTTFSTFLDELILNEKLFEKITGKKMDSIYREPKGEFSMRTLNIISDLGYRSYFWSAAYKDWDDKLTKEEAYQSLIERVHNGAIYLLHPTSKGNYLALADFIKEMKKEGYTFDLVKNIS